MSAPPVLDPARPFPYAQAEYEEVPCNVCGGTDVEPFCRRDRNGLRVRSVICRRCGLMFISPRMTPAWYQRYYEVEYRRQTASFKRTLKKKRKTGEAGLQARFEGQRRRGTWLAEYLRKLGVTAPRRILEIGSSTGGVLRGLADAFGAEALGIEPSPEEAAFAREQGVPTRVGFFEELGGSLERDFDVVLCLQSFNHLLDPRAVAERAREVLAPDGVFFVECMDFFLVCELRQSVRFATQVDHVFMFVPSTLQALVATAGFEPVPGSRMVDRELAPEERAHQKLSQGLPTTHMRMLLRPAAARPGPPTSGYAEVRSELDSLPDSELVARWRLLRKYALRLRKLVQQRVRRRRKQALRAARRVVQRTLPSSRSDR